MIDPNDPSRYLRLVRFWIALFICGLVLSGVTAIPLVTEVGYLFRAANRFQHHLPAEIFEWIQAVYAALLDTHSRYPFLFYGTDWLAFGHFVIALAFIGPYRDPVRNVWVIHFGLIGCLLVIPYAFIFGAAREIPWWWRLIDSAFGILGLVPLLFARKYTRQLAAQTGQS